jgi:hypothetical protein
MLPRNRNKTVRGASYANAIKLLANTTVIFERHNVAHAQMRDLGGKEKQHPGTTAAIKSLHSAIQDKIY